MGKVSGIYLCKVKKKPRIEIDEGKFIADYGLEGDAYSEYGIVKQVPVFFDESRSSLSDEPFSGLCFQRFLETIRISGLKADSLKSDGIIEIGTAVFRISNIRKKCYPECKIIQDNRHCALFRDVRFCKVLQTGIIRKGDNVTVIS